MFQNHDGCFQLNSWQISAPKTQQSTFLSNLLLKTKASYESWEAQLTRFDSWPLTARILLSKVLFFSLKKGPDYGYEIYQP